MNVQYVCVCVWPIIWISYNHLKLVTWVTTAHLIYPYNTVATHKTIFKCFFPNRHQIKKKTHFKITFMLFFIKKILKANLMMFQLGRGLWSLT